MVYVFLQLEESVHGGTEKLGMAQPVSYVLVFLFGLDGDVVFVAFAVVVVAGDGSVESFLFPFDYVLEGDFLVPGGVGDEPVFVGEGPDLLFMNIPAGEAQIGEVLRGGAVGVKVGIDAGSALLVGAVEFGEGVPDFSLNLEVILKVVDDGVVLLDIGPVVVLVEFGGDVVGGVGVLMRQCGIHFVVEDGIILEHPEVGLFFGGREQLKGVVLVGAETPGRSGDSSCQHYYQYDYYPSIEIYNINSSMLSHKLGLILPRITAQYVNLFGWQCSNDILSFTLPFSVSQLPRRKLRTQEWDIIRIFFGFQVGAKWVDRILQSRFFRCRVLSKKWVQLSQWPCQSRFKRCYCTEVFLGSFQLGIREGEYEDTRWSIQSSEACLRIEKSKSGY